ncbi:MAG: lipid-A-disaccharide synthase-related protein [Bacillota bacterium]|nr:lipid-A-disaccharide synthase-related protein [Bacillota bacterium]
MTTVLVLSNGHGEDVIGAMIAQEVRALRPSLDVVGFPLVGLGKPYRDARIRIVGVQRPMPSGGFAKHGARLLLRDLRAGLFSLTVGQMRHLRAMAPTVSLTVCVGDAYPLLLAGLFVRRPILCLSTAKSEYIHGHYGIETWLMRRLAGFVLARDERTCAALAAAGVRAGFAGNIMMDGFSITGENFGLTLEKKVVGILPGSRDEAYRNMVEVLEIVRQLADTTGNGVDFVAGLAPSLNRRFLAQAVQRAGWRYAPGGAGDLESGIVGRLYPDGNDKPCVILTQGRFGDVLNVSNIVIGLSGTGNEQAAGLGRPVVAYPAGGPQFNERFARAQKRLLGDALALVEGGGAEAVAREVLSILGDSERIARMRRAGHERMGEQGAATRTAKIIVNYLDTGRWEGCSFEKS